MELEKNNTKAFFTFLGRVIINNSNGAGAAANFVMMNLGLVKHTFVKLTFAAGSYLLKAYSGTLPSSWNVFFIVDNDDMRQI